MTDAPEPVPGAPAPGEFRPQGEEPPVSLKKILQENPFLVKMIVFFFFMLFVPLALAWKFDLFLVAN
jgi:hypothetical protein